MIAGGQPAAVLTGINSVIRRIDLSCKLLAPVLSGFFISFVSMEASAAALAAWNLAAVWVQYWLFVSVYAGFPALIETSQISRRRADDDEAAAAAQPQKVERLWMTMLPCWESWAVYARQEVVLPGVALAFLYFTVLSFGTLMTATLDWEGIPAYVISLARGVSAAVGIAATWVYPAAHAACPRSARPLVHLGAVVLPPRLRRLRLGRRRRAIGVGVDADGRRGGVAAGAVDVRPRRDAADAGRRPGERPVRRRRRAELAAVHVRPAHLRHGHHRLRPQGTNTISPMLHMEINCHNKNFLHKNPTSTFNEDIYMAYCDIGKNIALKSSFTWF